MNEDQLKKSARDIINKEKWWDILSRFIEVLRINIFMVDYQGHILLPAEAGKYGGRFLTDKALSEEFLKNSVVDISQFEHQGKFLEYKNQFELSSFAIPINFNGQHVIAYMMVGPVVLNKRLDNREYEQIAQHRGLDANLVLNEINEIRVVSNVMMNSILDLLYEIVRDNVELSIREKELDQIKLGKGQSPDKIKEVVKEIYSTVRLDELLATLLDLALQMTGTECGSIMVVDDEKGDLTIKVSRGLDKKRIEKTRVKIGEGIAGIAAQENTPFVISGQSGDNRIKHLLRRSEIKHSLVMPLIAKERVFGVLNLHTKGDEDRIEGNLDNLQYLSKLLSSAF